MLEDLTQDIIAAKEDLRRKRDLESSLSLARRSLRRQRRRLCKLQERLAAESADVEVLEELSLQALFYTLLGDRRERIKKDVRSWWLPGSSTMSARMPLPLWSRR